MPRIALPSRLVSMEMLTRLLVKSRDSKDCIGGEGETNWSPWCVGKTHLQRNCALYNWKATGDLLHSSAVAMEYLFLLWFNKRIIFFYNINKYLYVFIVIFNDLWLAIFRFLIIHGRKKERKEWKKKRERDHMLYIFKLDVNTCQYSSIWVIFWRFLWQIMQIITD